MWFGRFPDHDFNSIKVRLKHGTEQTDQFLVNAFQFHKGTIKTERLKAAGINPAYFNSIKVRLKLMSFIYNSTLS